MKLSPSQKKKLVESARSVYLGYVALDFFKNHSFNIDGQKTTLFAECQTLTQALEKRKNLVINHVNYELSLEGESPKYQISLKRVMGSSPAEMKPLLDYKDQDLLNIFTKQKLTIEEQNSQYHLSNTIQDKVNIGGPEKMDLYRTHLSTLHDIIKKLETEDDTTNLLIALATGTGKTFVQALWLLILNLAGNHAFFAVPDKLVRQFQKDLKRLLPDVFVEQVKIIRQGAKQEDDEALLSSLEAENSTPQMIIASSEQLLDDHYQALAAANPQTTFLSFDEQHLIMKYEARRVRLIELSKRMLTMFLTATPNRETYDLAGQKPVAIMSSGQKQKSGQGQFPVMLTLEAENITDKNSLRNYHFWTVDFWRNILNSILLSFSNSIQEECSSIGVSIVEHLPFLIHYKPDENNARWGMQVPMARKMLFIVDDNETLINFANALKSLESYASYVNASVYKNGNLVDRSEIASFFQIPDAEREVQSEDSYYKRSEYTRNLAPFAAHVGSRISQINVKEQIRYNISHAMIEYLLTDLTGLDEITLNRMRKEQPQELQALVKRALNANNPPRQATYYIEKLKTLIDEKGATEVATILNSLYELLKKYSQDEELQPPNQSNKDKNFNDFVDNWYLNYELIDKLNRNDNNLWNQLKGYVDKHFMLGVMSGMSTAETPIEESKPFFGFNKETYSMYNDGVLVDRAKKRKRTSLETLNDESYESMFTPNYNQLTEEQADNYFRLGFVGVYVSNKKTEGFSDRNLHTVVNLSERKISPTNSPDALIQGIGRNRGLDDTIVPTYIHARGRGEATTFDLNNLKKDDYYPDLFTAQSQYNKEFLQVLGERVGLEIVQWFNGNVAPDDSIDQELLKRQTLKIIARALREINDKNDHNIELSRGQLSTVISIAMDTLDTQIKQMKDPFKLSIFIKVLGSVANFISEVYYFFKRIPPYFGILYFRLFGENQPKVEGQSTPDEVYIKILNNLSYKQMVEKINVAREFQGWLVRGAKGAEHRITKNIDLYLTDDINQKMAEHHRQFFWPMFAKFVVPEKRQLVLNALKNFSLLVTFCQENEETLQKFMEPAYPKFREDALAIMQQIQGLEDLTLEDMIDYPKILNQTIGQLQSSPLQIVKQDAKLRAHLIADLGPYLSGPFLKHAAALFAMTDYQQLNTSLTTGDNAKQFLEYALTTDLDLGNSDTLITSLKTFFKLDDFKTLDQRALQYGEALQKLQKEFVDSPQLLIKEEKIDEILAILQNKILPSLINLYPIENRQDLFALITPLRLKEILIAEGMELFANTEPQAFAEKLFSKLNNGQPLPEPINLAEEINHSREVLQDKFMELAGSSPISLVMDNLFSPTKWFSAAQNPHYLLEPRLTQFIESEEFFNAISLLLPYTTWLDLKDKIKNNKSTTIQFARALLDIAKSDQEQGKSSSLNENRLLELVNQFYATHYQTSIVVTEEGMKEFAAIRKALDENPLPLLNENATSKLSNTAHDSLLPLLANFIKNPEKKAAFVNTIVDKATMVNYLYQNRNHLMQLNSANSLVAAMHLINSLIPNNPEKLTQADLVNPEQEAQHALTHMVTESKTIAIRSYLASEHFSELLYHFFNPEDYAAIKLVLADPIKVDALMNKLLAQGIDSLDEAQLIALFRSEDSLKSIQSIKSHLNAFEQALQSIAKNRSASVDKSKIADLLVEMCVPALFHPEFYSSLNELLGFLTVEDLTTLIETLGKENPKDKAEQILDLLDILKEQDVDDLQELFLTLPAESGMDFEKLPLAQTIKLMADLLEDIANCHGHYNQHDIKGAQGSQKPAKLLEHVSPNLRSQKVEASDSFFSGFSRKIFFIQAVRNGLPTVSQVNGDSSAIRLKHLERVKDHILRPLWWTNNTSGFGYRLVKAGRDFVYAVQNFAFAVLNFFKRIANFFTNNYFTISQRNPVSSDFNDTAFQFSKDANELVPLDA
ncbi:MAG: DEAD/DEAH box helicase, partial [Legionella sp.]